MFRTRKIIDKVISLEEMKRVVTRADKSTFANGYHPGTAKEDTFIRDNEKRDVYLKILFELVSKNKHTLFGKSDDPRMRKIWLSSGTRMVVDGYRNLNYFEFGDIKVKPDELFSVLRDRKDAIAGLPEKNGVYVTTEDHTKLTYDDWDRLVSYLTEVKGYRSISRRRNRREVGYTDPKEPHTQKYVTLKALDAEMREYYRGKEEKEN